MHEAALGAQMLRDDRTAEVAELTDKAKGVDIVGELIEDDAGHHEAGHVQGWQQTQLRIRQIEVRLQACGAPCSALTSKVLLQNRPGPTPRPVSQNWAAGRRHSHKEAGQRYHRGWPRFSSSAILCSPRLTASATM